MTLKIFNLAAVLPPAASNWAEDMDFVFWFINWVCIISFFLVEGALIYFVIKYRRKKNEENKKTPFITHSTRLEIVWTIIPTIVVMIIFYVGAKLFIDMRTMPQDAMQINITGKQWSWDFAYENGVKGNTQASCSDINQKTMTDCEKAGAKWELGDMLRVPVGKNVKMWMTSADVLHSFYIPAFRVKQDLVPGMYSFLWFNANKPGVYDIFCAEYCGLSHSGMIAKIEALPEQQYIAWLNEKAKGASAVAADIPVAERIKIGSSLFAKKGCVACHSISGQRVVGPPLNGLVGRKEVLANGKTVVANEEYIRESIMDPMAKIVKDYPAAMPPQSVTDDEVRSLIEYFRSLK